AFHAAVAAAGFHAPVVAHSIYLINLGSPDADCANKSMDAMEDELRRAHALGVPGIVLHPGAHMGEGEEWGIATVAERINRLFDRTADVDAGIWLETTAGQGSAFGYRFEHLAEII